MGDVNSHFSALKHSLQNAPVSEQHTATLYLLYEYATALDQDRSLLPILGPKYLSALKEMGLTPAKSVARTAKEAVNDSEPAERPANAGSAASAALHRLRAVRGPTARTA